MPLDLLRPARSEPRAQGLPPLVAWPVSVAVHIAVLAAALVIPLMATDVLPSPREVVDWMQATPVPEPPVAPMAARPAPAAAQAIVTQCLAPVSAPPAIGQETGFTIPPDTGLGDAPRGTATVPGLEGGVPDRLDRPPNDPAPETPVRPGGKIRPPEKILHIVPQYPELAIRAHVQGVVIIEAIIGKTGMVEEARVLRSVPLLDAAALAAVRGWRYTPTLLNGQPVSIIMTVTVQFTLQEPPPSAGPASGPTA